ncbi:ATP-dependent protease [Stenotrophomonas phage Salva]|uniref:ATP-dependent protease n=1 Tax=Stenotrophomonas phage Salva TaxID=2801524 RepID=A0A7U3WJV6_9CAUD|nr:ATP-dependent protease [Stenotrophomonas phage Salva]QQM18189.1 ATP-dependent protease [Stenotrophomonas phage Salva]
MSDKVFHCEVKAEKYKGKLTKLTGTGEFYYRPPFRVVFDELSIHAPNKRFDHMAIKNLGVGNSFIDSRGDRWTRIA